jgi:hypothetical protein
MGFRYILVNHTRKVIEDASLQSIWSLMSYLIEKEGWRPDDKVEMMFEENKWDEIGKLVRSGYKSHYYFRDFD